MGRPVCAAYADRNIEIARSYTEDKKSLRELADAVGLSTVRLRSILEDQGIELRPEPRRSRIDQRSKSNILIAIGAKLHADRMKRGVSLSEYAILLGLSETRLSEALQGLYNWKFNEILRAAAVLAIPLENIMKPPEGLHG
jgi:hypothetical protein